MAGGVDPDVYVVSRCECLLDLVHRLHRYERVFRSEVHERRASKIGRLTEGVCDSRPVVGHRNVGAVPRGDQVGQAPAETEPHDPCSSPGLGELPQMCESRLAVGESLLEVEAPHQLVPALEAGLVVIKRHVPLDAPEEIRSQNGVPHRAETFRHCPEVTADSEDLLKQENPGSLSAFGGPDEPVEVIASGCINLLSSCRGHPADSMSKARCRRPGSKARLEGPARRNPRLPECRRSGIPVSQNVGVPESPCTVVRHAETARLACEQVLSDPEVSDKEKPMSPVHSRSQFVDELAREYTGDHTDAPDETQEELQAVTRERTGRAAGMQIGDDQAVFMEILARSMGARSGLEIGTFTGYSALAVARGMGPEGHLLCCDVSEEWTAIAREYWEKAGVSDRIELKIGPAIETLRALPETAQFDIAFLDADKVGYPDYYEEIIPRLREGGLLIVDNTLQGGRVLDPEATDDSTLAVRTLNERIASDDRVRTVMLPLGDGITLAEKVSGP